MGRRLTDREAFAVDRIEVRFANAAQAQEAAAFVPALVPIAPDVCEIPSDLIHPAREKLQALGIPFDEGGDA